MWTHNFLSLCEDGLQHSSLVRLDDQRTIELIIVILPEHSLHFGLVSLCHPAFIIVHFFDRLLPCVNLVEHVDETVLFLEFSILMVPAALALLAQDVLVCQIFCELF